MGRKFAWVLFAAAVATAGCGDDDHGGSPDAAASDAATDGTTGVAMGVVEGKVFHAVTLEPLPNAIVKVLTEEGEREVTTDATGKFETNAPISAEAMVKSEATGQTATMKGVPVHEGEASYVELFSLPVGKHEVIDAAAGATIEGPYGATLKLPPNGLVHEDGTPVSGMVDVTLTSMLPQDPKQLAARPGRARGRRADGSRARLRPWTTLVVTLRQAGAPVNLAPGQTAQLKMPLADPGGAPKTVAMWNLDEATGEWVEEGAVTKVSTQAGAAYKGEVSHFSFWSGEAPIEQTTCLRGCVTGGTGAARIIASAVDELFRDEVTTDLDGCFAVDVPAAGRVRLQVAGRNGATGRMWVEVSEGEGTADDPGSCQDVGTLEITTTDHDACPRGTTPCGDRCVDKDSDVRHCGECGFNCVTDAELGVDGALSGVACVEGQCGCPPSRPDIAYGQEGPECVDTQSDRRYCGNLDTACLSTEECVDGTCVEVDCPEGTSACQVCDAADCYSACVDTTSDPRHCGGCAQVDEGAEDCSWGAEGQVCVNGMCQCPRGTELCEIPDLFYGCVDFSSSMEHCGGCDQECIWELPGAVCVDGQCTCREGLTDCAFEEESFTYCVDTQWESFDCGACGVSCDDGVCFEGECAAAEACDGQQVYCRGECIDLGTTENCAGCGDACPENEACAEGQCACQVDEPHIEICGDDRACTDVYSDPLHCGRCDRACRTGERCVSGVCVL